MDSFKWPSREPSFFDTHFWVIPVVMFSVFFIISGLMIYCAYKHRHQLARWRRPAVVVVQSSPGCNSSHNVDNYPVWTPMNPYYPGAVEQSAQGVSTTHIAGNNPSAPPMGFRYPGDYNNYPNVPPSYTDEPVVVIDNKPPK